MTYNWKPRKKNLTGECHDWPVLSLVPEHSLSATVGERILRQTKLWRDPVQFPLYRLAEH